MTPFPSEVPCTLPKINQGALHCRAVRLGAMNWERETLWPPISMMVSTDSTVIKLEENFLKLNTIGDPTTGKEILIT